VRGLVVTSVLLAGLFSLTRPVEGQLPEPVVHALLFYSPTCPHCHEVINDVLIPMQEEYGSRLVVLGFDTSQPVANNLYWAVLRHYEIGQEEWVVPILVVGDETLIGGIEIPSRLPGIVEAGLAGGGIDLPELPELISFLEEEGMLDRRFPDRRIAVQDPPVGERSAQEVPDQAVAPEEDLPAEPLAAAAAADSAGTSVDTIPAQVQDVSGPPAPEEGGRQEAGASATPRGEVAEADSAEAEGTEAEGAEAGGAEAGGAEAGGAEAGGAEGGAVEEAPAPEAEAPVAGVEPAAAEGAGSAEGPMGLAQAARDLEAMTMWDRFKQDPAGNSLAVLVLLFMVASLLLKGYPPRARGTAWPLWVVPALIVVGFVVAAYLSYIEVTQTAAVCGPVGDCNTVNQSRYAILFGVLPVGVLGLMGYVVVLALWALGGFGPEGLRDSATLGAWGAVLSGTLFSAYLTFLEPFVIGATCAWCLTSAVVMTLLLWASAPTARDAWPTGGSSDA